MQDILQHQILVLFIRNNPSAIKSSSKPNLTKLKIKTKETTKSLLLSKRNRRLDWLAPLLNETKICFKQKTVFLIEIENDEI